MDWEAKLWKCIYIAETYLLSLVFRILVILICFPLFGLFHPERLDVIRS